MIYSPGLGLWLMTYDGGRQKLSTTGVYFCYASAPWGPWSTPQLIFNDKRDHGLGVFIYSANTNYLDSNLAGPTIGGADPATTPGGSYAPYLVERFTQISSNKLSLYYTLSTWNPYTTVLMQSDFAITPSAGTNGNWAATWGTSPIAPTATNSNNTGFTNQTVRMICHTSLGGNQVRLRVANIFGTNALVLDAAHVAIAGPNGTTIAGTDTTLTFGGAGAVSIPPGAMITSDSAAMEVPGLTNLAVSLFVSGANGPATWHPDAIQTNYVSTTGDYTAAPSMPVDHTVTVSYYLTDIDVATATNALAIVTFGDSITDGFHSTPDANHRWPDYLAGRLAAGGETNLAVVNEGIVGNRLLQDGMGPSGLSRFERDVLEQTGVGYVTVLLGVNDIGHSSVNQPVSAAELIDGYLQLVGQAHSQGLKIFGCTLLPFGLSAYDSTAHETLRETVNAFIRTNNAFDGVIDFDVATRDPAIPTQLLTNYDSGDHLHPNDAGYQAIAAAVNLSLFQGSTPGPFRPALSFTGVSNEVALSWAAGTGGVFLQETSSLMPPVTWQHSPLTPSLSNGLFTVSVPAWPSTTRFFRVWTTP